MMSTNKPRPVPDPVPLDLSDFADDFRSWRTNSDQMMVEAAGVEPASEYETERAATCLVRRLSSYAASQRTGLLCRSLIVVMPWSPDVRP